MSIKSFSIVSFLLSWLVLNNIANTPVLGGQTGQKFLATTNCAEDNTKMYLWFSNDGKDWHLLNGGYSYRPPRGICAEPSIFYNQNNGKYYIAYSDASAENLHFGVAESADLVTWTFTASVKGPIFPATAPIWCPEWFVDDDGNTWADLTMAGTRTIQPIAFLDVGLPTKVLAGDDSPMTLGLFDVISISGENETVYNDRRTGYTFIWSMTKDNNGVIYAGTQTTSAANDRQPAILASKDLYHWIPVYYVKDVNLR